MAQDTLRALWRWRLAEAVRIVHIDGRQVPAWLRNQDTQTRQQCYTSIRSLLHGVKDIVGNIHYMLGARLCGTCYFKCALKTWQQAAHACTRSPGSRAASRLAAHPSASQQKCWALRSGLQRSAAAAAAAAAEPSSRCAEHCAQPVSPSCPCPAATAPAAAGGPTAATPAAVCLLMAAAAAAAAAAVLLLLLLLLLRLEGRASESPSATGARQVHAGGGSRQRRGLHRSRYLRKRPPLHRRRRLRDAAVAVLALPDLVRRQPVAAAPAGSTNRAGPQRNPCSMLQLEPYTSASAQPARLTE